MSTENNDSVVKLDKELRLKDDFTPPTYEEWREKVEVDLKGAPFEKKLVTKTYEGISLQPIYTRKDLEKLPVTDEKPGFGNSVRGTKASGYVGKPWDIAQEIIYGDAEEFNNALLNDLERGQTAVNIKLDTATQMGLDADYAPKENVGDKGLSISALRSITRALKDVELSAVPLYVETGFSALPMLSVLNAYLKKENIDVKGIKGSVEADPLTYLAAEGKLPVSLDYLYDELKVVTEWAKENAGDLKTIGVNGYVYNNAGASAVQELAYMLSTAVEYITELTERGMSVADVAKKIKFNTGIGSNFFMEIAKLRAARVLWAKVLESYGVADSKLFIHGKTSQFTQTVYDPYVNMLRTTTEAFSAVVGGVDSLHTNPFDEIFGTADQFSRRISRNTQIILMEESHMDQLIDPAGGSYYVEHLTNEIVNAAWKLFLEIEEKGGMFEALKAGMPHAAIDETMALRLKDIKKRKASVVGTNMYANIKEEKLNKPKPDFEAFHKKRSEYLQAFRTSGNTEKHEGILNKLQELADKASEDAVNTGSEAILEGATIGEISKATRANAGEAVEIKPVKLTRLSVIFEELRDAATEYKNKNGYLPKLFLATMGPVKQHKARADFARGFFEAGGFDVIYPKGFGTPEEAAKAAVESGAKVAVLCSTDDTYPELVPAFVKEAKGAEKEMSVVLAGYPKDQIEAHKASGVDEFIFMGADTYSILAGLLKKLGAL